VAACNRGQHRHKRDSRGTVVQQAFRLDQQPESTVKAGLFEGGYDRHRIRGGDEYAEHNRAAPIPVQGIAHAERCNGGRQRHADSRENTDDRKILFEVMPMDAECRFKHQGRQEPEENQIFRQVQRLSHRGQGQRHAGENQADGVGQVQAARQHRHQRGHEQQNYPL
jgi:hypothetical protein